MSFTQFNFHPKIVSGINACRYEKPTPIQEKAIPFLLDGRDIMGLAQTGTGKTAAFVLPILQHLLKRPHNKIRTLVIAPTRELAEQIHNDIGRLAVNTGIRSAAVYGGVGKQPQINKIRAGVEIVVACPGRLLDHLRDGSFRLDNVEHLVLDEADHMFDMGFLPDIRRILKFLPEQRQTLLFSATMPGEIRHLAEEILDNPALVQINHSRPAATVDQALFSVEQDRKVPLLKHLMAGTDTGPTLIFTRTKYRAQSLARKLQKAGYAATSLQGNLSQQNRRKALQGFKNGEFKILVATDIAARGIDVAGISHVINYDVPDTVEAYTHRIGRTGRAACTGEAFTFACRSDRKIITLIEKSLGRKMNRVNAPDLAPECVERNTSTGQTSGRSNTGLQDNTRPKQRHGRPKGANAGQTGGKNKLQSAWSRKKNARCKRSRAVLAAGDSSKLFLNP